MNVLDLFSGIGGFSLGLERAGMKTVAFCEIDPFPRAVLAKHWPEVPCYDDVRTISAERLAADGVAGIDVICGGFPCQDISVAGHQRGMGEGTRSGLWSECRRLIGEIRPQFAIFENVANLLAGPSNQPGGWFSTILCDLAECGYDAEWRNIPAWHVGLPHGRERVWVVAYPAQVRPSGELFQEDRSRRHEARETRTSLLPPYHDGLGSAPDSYSLRDGDGFPALMGCLNALGNAVVPQIPELIGRAIMAQQERLAA